MQHSNKKKVTGILYLQNIQDNRWTKPPPMRILESLNAAEHLIFVTTHWDQINPERGQERETNIRSRLQGFLKAGARTDRFNIRTDSPWRIIESLVYKEKRAPRLILPVSRPPATSTSVENNDSSPEPSTSTPEADDSVPSAAPEPSSIIVPVFRSRPSSTSAEDFVPSAPPEPGSITVPVDRLKPTPTSAEDDEFVPATDPEPSSITVPVFRLAASLTPSDHFEEQRQREELRQAEEKRRRGELEAQRQHEGERKLAEVRRLEEEKQNREAQRPREKEEIEKRRRVEEREEKERKQAEEKQRPVEKRKQKRDKAQLLICTGPPGSGKSQFIDSLTQKTKWAGASLEPQKHGVRHVELKNSDLPGTVILLDTPGFDDLCNPDVFEEVEKWLQSKRNQNQVAAVLYFHNITDKRMTVRPPFRDLKKLCGDDPKKVFVTTHWDYQEREPGKWNHNETELKDGRWKPFLDSGARAIRFDKTTTTAMEIVQKVLSSSPPVGLKGGPGC